MIRMGVIYAFLAVLGTWQWHFIIEGIGHNVYLNGMIFGVFFFGSILAFRDLLEMTNERLAFEALQETYSDIQQNAVRSKEDPFWRHYRCLEKGTVFYHPQLFGHLYDLILEELHRTKQMQISVTTMQNLVSAIDHSNSQKRSLLQYLSGLLVFLGLIGTFIGLMEMVASVGGIIGGLANADSGSGDAMKNLLRDLKAPLTGMATGFAASLFGLFTSLVIGLVNRFVNSAAHAIKAEFEAWLAGIAQIENEKNTGSDSGSGAGAGAGGGGYSNADGSPVQDATFMAAPGVAAIITAMRSTNHTFERTADAVMALAERRKEENDALMATLAQMERLTAEQDSMRRAITALSTIRDDINGLRQLDYAQANRIVEGFDKLEFSLQEARTTTTKGFEAIALQEIESLKQGKQNTEIVLSKIEQISDQAVQSHLSTVDRLETLAQLQGSLTRLLQSTQEQTVNKVEDLQSSLSEMHALHSDLVQNITATRGDITSGIRELIQRPDVSPQIEHMSVSMDTTLVKSLGEISQVLNTALGIMTASMRDIASRQAETANVLTVMSDTKELTTEIRMLGRSIDSGLSAGFSEMSRSFESIFLSYSDLLAKVGTGAQNAQRAPGGSIEAAHNAERVAVPMVDATAERQASDSKKPVNEMTVNQRLEHMQKLMTSAQGRLPDLMKNVS